MAESHISHYGRGYESGGGIPQTHEMNGGDTAILERQKLEF
jgi:hypothetical protein